MAMPQGNSSPVADGRFFYARQGSAAAKNLAQQDRFLGGGSVDIRRGIVGPRQPGLNGHDAVRIETGLHLEQVPKTAQQKARGDHEHGRERQFTDDQDLAGTRAFPCAAGAASFLPERTDQIDTAHEPRGNKPEDGSGCDRDGHSKYQHSPSNRDIVEVREALRNKPQQEMLGTEENGKTSDSAKQEEQQALGQKLADEARSLRSQGLSNRDLTASPTGPGEQEIGYVDATDQQDQSYRTEEQNERLVNAADHAFAERTQAHGPCGLCRILRRILLFQRLNQRIEVPLCGRNRETWLQSPDYATLN